MNKILEWIERISAGLAKIVEYLVAVALVFLFVLIFSEIVGRSLLGVTIAWMMEAVGFLLAFITFLGISVHVYRRKLLSLEFVREKLFRTPRAITFFSIFTWLVLLAYAYVLITEGLVFAERGIDRLTPSRRFELYHMRLILPVGGVLVFVQGVLNIAKEIGQLVGIDITPAHETAADDEE